MQRLQAAGLPLNIPPTAPNTQTNSNADLYNGCTLRAGLLLNNTGSTAGEVGPSFSNKMYDYPLGCV